MQTMFNLGKVVSLLDGYRHHPVDNLYADVWFTVGFRSVSNVIEYRQLVMGSHRIPLFPNGAIPR